MAKESTKNKLLRASSILFSQNSYSDLTTREIADKAKVNLSAIKYYFSSKENLFIETLTILLKDIKKDDIDSLDFTGDLTKEEALSRFKSFVRSFTYLMSLPRQVHPCKMMLRELLATNKKNKKLCDQIVTIITNEFMLPFNKQVVKLLGYVAPHLTNEEKQHAFEVLCAMCSHYLLAGDFIKKMYGANANDSDTLDKFSSFITNFTLKGLGVN